MRGSPFPPCELLCLVDRKNVRQKRLLQLCVVTFSNSIRRNADVSQPSGWYCYNRTVNTYTYNITWTIYLHPGRGVSSKRLQQNNNSTTPANTVSWQSSDYPIIQSSVVKTGYSTIKPTREKHVANNHLANGVPTIRALYQQIQVGRKKVLHHARHAFSKNATRINAVLSHEVYLVRSEMRATSVSKSQFTIWDSIICHAKHAINERRSMINMCMMLGRAIASTRERSDRKKLPSMISRNIYAFRCAGGIRHTLSSLRKENRTSRTNYVKREKYP